jgi:nickel-dependent lactate racemase
MPSAAAVDRAVESLLGRAAVAGRDVLVLLPDRTRPFPFDGVLPPFVSALLAAGADPGRIVFAIASGTHVTDPADLAPLRRLLPAAPAVLAPLPEDRMVSVGTTRRGTDVRVHPRLLEADVVFSLDALALHYFAGFGGGGKMLFPGLGARASIAANHRLSLAPERGLAPGVEPGRTHDNPVALDLREAHDLLPRAHHLTLVPSEGEAGFAVVPWSDYAEFDRACSAFAAECRRGERHGADVVLAFAEGAVAIDVVQAHKALFHAALYARDGADVILFAECAEGVGSPALARWLARPDRARLEAEARSAYDLNAQTAISLAAIAERTRVTWVSSRPLSELAAWGITVAPDPDGSLRLGEIAAAEGRKVVRLDHPTRRLPAA